MAEVRKITIEIVEGSGGGGGGSDDDEKKKKKTKAEREAEKRKKAWQQIGKNAFRSAKNIIISNVENSLQRQYTLTENYMAQTTYNNAKRAISTAVSLGTTLYGSLKLGLMTGNPVGVAASVAVSTAAWGFNQFTEYKNRMSSYYQSLNAGNYQSDFSQIRAGLIDGSKGTEN